VSAFETGSPIQPEAPAEHWLRQEQALAGFAPSEGFYCTSLRVPAPGVPGLEASGGWWPALREPPSLARLHERPVFCGNPLLFPFPMGISGGTLRYQGRDYPLQPTRERRVVHGVVRDQPWTVERTWTDGEGDHIRATITNAGSEEMLRQYPFPFRFSATQTLRGATLTMETEAVNLHDAPMPAALGIHPYVPFPMIPGGSGEDCVVWSDVTHRMETSGDDEGRLTPVEGVADLRQTPRVVDLLAEQAPRQPNGGMMYTYANEPGDARGVRWSMTDTRHRLSVRVETAPDFRSVVLWAPRTPTVCVSPVICTVLPNGFNLAARGQNTGMVELEPGQTWRTWARITATAG
jgi:galactose mutarotase-like enzyme